jgi:hypothetical protein
VAAGALHWGDRFQHEQPRQLDEAERARIVALASDIPALWHAPATTAAERKEIVRLLVERVVVHVRADSERTGVEIAWRGGLVTHHEAVRAVARYESLRDYPELLKRIRQFRKGGLTIAQVAARLNEEGHKAPRSPQGYTATSVRKLLWRLRQKAEDAGKPSAQGAPRAAPGGK